MPKFTAAVVQLNSTEDKQHNLAEAEQLVEQASRDGAQWVMLPEMFNCLGNFAAMIAQAEPLDGPTSRFARELARRLGITLLAGSFCEQSDLPDKAYNTSLLISPTGDVLAVYRKIHLFDVEIAGQVSICESNFITGGSDIVCTETPLARIGQSICYDLRFPELYRRLIDDAAEVIAVPSAFTKATGQRHWHVLLRARAIENQAFVIAANQVGAHTPKLTSYGHSMIIDPWGEVLAELDGDQPGVACAEIDLAVLQQMRQQLPALAHRKHLERGVE